MPHGSVLGVKPMNLAWGIGSLGTITMISAVSGLYLFFLVSVMKVPPATAGLLIFISKIVDMVSDPLMGWISDKTNSRWGRRRPYMFFASFLCAGSLILLFALPQEPPFVSLEAYVFIGLCVYALALTAFNVPYLAMPAEMTTDYHERSSLMSYRAVFLISGGFVGTALAGPIIKEFGGGSTAYAILGIILASIVFISMMTAVFGTKKARFTRFSKPTIPRLDQVRLFFMNKPFLILSATKAFQFLQLAASGAAALFFFISVMNRDEALLLPFGLSIILGSVLSIRLWLPVIKALGKRNVLIGALAVQSLLHLSWLFAGPAETLATFIARAAGLGIVGGAILVCSQSMIVDTIEYDRKLSGINREGLYSSIFSFVEKSMHALGPLIVGILLAKLGYDASIPRGQPQPESALLAIQFGQAWLPAICSLGMICLLFFYRLDEDDLNQVSLHDIGQKPASVVPEGGR